MKWKFAVVVAVVLGLAGTARALYSVSDTGDWPESWGKELEPLRKQARTYVGPSLPARHFAIRFEKREEFEAAWPHILKVKSPGAAIVLVRREKFFLGEKAGVVVHAPPEGQEKNPNTPAKPIDSDNARTRYRNMTYIELVVDGDIVDLNRLELPKDTPIVDERFEKK
jgi:hypothetical protein